MRAFRWIIIAAAGGLLVSGVVAVLGTRGMAGIETAATGVKPSPPLVREAQLRPPAVAQRPTAPAPAAPAGPQRVETTMYDSWVVTCEDTIVGGAAKRSCMASLRVQSQNQMVLNWQIGFNDEGHYVTAVRLPSGLVVRNGDKTLASPPILVAKGVELKFGNGPARRLSYVSCGPQQCMAEGPIDDAFIREALPSAKATITVYTAGGTVPFDLSIKGIDKAISFTRK